MARWEDAYPDAAEVWDHQDETPESESVAQKMWEDDKTQALLDFTGCERSAEIRRFVGELMANEGIEEALEPIIVKGLARIYEDR